MQHNFSCPVCSTPRTGLCPPSLNLGHSMASSCLSSSTCKTTSRWGCSPATLLTGLFALDWPADYSCLPFSWPWLDISLPSSRTHISVSEVLQMCSEDAEETLYELGFGCDEPQVTVRIPPRFFTFPSQAQGINFRLFLDAQLRRIREEDPSLSLASKAEFINSL